MSLYKSIADFYDEIFPLKSARLSFVSSLLNKSALDILDIGCASGELALALAKNGHHVFGIDLDPNMVELAREKAGSSENSGLQVEFYEKDMLKVGTDFSPSSFDAVLCFGNTLVHLENLEKMEELFRGVFKVLKKGGIFILQVVNYDRVLSEGVKELPLIERENFTFHRKYHVDRVKHRIGFHTRLVIKETGQVLAGSETLYPLTFKELNSTLVRAGFTELQFFGNESKAPFSKESPALIAAGGPMAWGTYLGPSGHPEGFFK